MNVVVNSEELIDTTEYQTIYTRCRINRCCYNRKAGCCGTAALVYISVAARLWKMSSINCYPPPPFFFQNVPGFQSRFLKMSRFFLKVLWEPDVRTASCNTEKLSI
jgi:hypothetical protein